MPEQGLNEAARASDRQAIATAHGRWNAMLKKLTGLAIAAGLAGAMMLSAGSASAERLVFMTGPAGGSWYPLGAAIKNMVEQDVSGTTVDIRPGAGLINLRAVSEGRSEEHTSELQSLMRISYAVFCFKKKK